MDSIAIIFPQGVIDTVPRWIASQQFSNSEL